MSAELIPGQDLSASTPVSSGSKLTRRQRRRRWILLTILLVLLAILAYSAYYFNQNRRLPGIGLAAPEEALQPPRFLYAITGEGNNTMQRPVGIGVANDRVYVIDFGKSRINVYNEQGAFQFSFNKIDGGDTLARPTCLAIHDNEIWVTDRIRRDVFIFDMNGKFLRRFAPKGEKLKWGPLAIGFGPDGGFAISDVAETRRHKVHFFSADGSRTATVGRTVQVNQLIDEPGGFLFPSGISIAEDGNIFVSDGDNRRVQVFDKTGVFQRFVDTSGIPRGSVIDAENRLYVVDALAHRVDIYSLDGQRLTQFGEQGFGPGQFNFPAYVALNEGTRIFVTDRENDQVQVWGWPAAEPPGVPVPSTPLGWLLCLSPLALLPFLLLLRKKRVVVTPDFVEALVTAGDIKSVSERRRLKLICPPQDHVFYAGRVEQDVDLGSLIDPEEFSDSDVRALMTRLELDERSAIFISMAERIAGLGTEDRDLRRIAVLAEVQVFNVEEFRARFLLNRSA